MASVEQAVLALRLMTLTGTLVLLVVSHRSARWLLLTEVWVAHYQQQAELETDFRSTVAMGEQQHLVRVLERTHTQVVVVAEDGSQAITLLKHLMVLEVLEPHTHPQSQHLPHLLATQVPLV